MVSLFSLIIILTLSMLITYIGATALMHTGLSKDTAMFQARSAFTGVGYTTEESESVVKHPVRRRILMSIMLVGNVGAISAIAGLILTFIQDDSNDLPLIWRLVILVASMTLLWLISRSKRFQKHLSRIVNKAIRRFTDYNVRDYTEILHLTGEYEITTMQVESDDWISDRKVKECNLIDEGINIIGIKRSDNSYLGIISGDTQIEAGDRLILYGREKNLKNLDKRKKGSRGNREHDDAVEENKRKELQQEQTEKKRKK